MKLTQRITDQLAASLAGVSQRVVCDRSIAPPSAPFAVALPPCGAGTCGSRRAAAATETDHPGAFTDLIAPACWSALSAYDRERLSIPAVPVARRAIDRLYEGAARVVDPGVEDVARVASADQRADIMLALGWLAASCVCLRALISSLPDDTPTGLYVRAGATPPTPGQLADDKRARERRRDKSACWSAYLKAKALERRRPPIGDLFAGFDFEAWDGLNRRQPSSPAS